MTEDEKRVVKRMYDTGDYLIKGFGGFFWANTNINGCLKEAASSDDVYIIQKLARENRGGIILEIKTI